MQNDFPLCLFCAVVLPCGPYYYQGIPPQTALVSFISRRATHCLFVFLFVVVHTFLVVFAVIELRNFVLILKSSDPSVNTLYLGIKAEVNSSV